MKKHYRASAVTNNGEAQIERLITRDFYFEEEQWHVFHDLVLHEHITQSQGQCDFVFVNKRGIVVLEVKDGKIGFEGGKFVQKPDGYHRTSRQINPVKQAMDNASSIKELLRNHNINNCFVCSAVAFPGCFFSTDDRNYNVHSLSRKETLRDFVVNVLEESRYNAIEGLKKKNPSQSEKFQSFWGELSSDRINEIVNILIPEVKVEAGDASVVINKKDFDFKVAENERILEGLRDNMRIMIQGPAGSGKSKYALKLITDKVRKDDAKGKYFCWNELLAAHMNVRFAELEISSNVEAVPLFQYATKLVMSAGLPPDTLTKQLIPKMRDILEKTITILKEQNTLQSYDFLVFDETQDMFDKGVDLLLDNCLSGGINGIEDGEYLVFYDELNAFATNINSQLYIDVLNLLRHNCAIYKMNDSFRASSVDGLTDFLNDLASGTPDFDREYGKDLKIIKYNHLEDLPDLIFETSQKLRSSFKMDSNNFVVLFTSNLISGNEIDDKPLDNLLNENHFLKLTNDNMGIGSEKIKYTTILKYKGIEKDAVILVIHDLFRQKSHPVYQVQVGAVRAKAKLYILIDRKSAEDGMSAD